MICVFTISGDRGSEFTLKCVRCNKTVESSTLKYIVTCISDEEISLWGVGTELESLLTEIGVEDGGCYNCKTAAIELNVRGVAWCSSHVPEVIALLETNRKKMGLLNQADAAKKIALAGYFTFESLILEAIRRAEEKDINTASVVSPESPRAASSS